MSYVDNIVVTNPTAVSTVEKIPEPELTNTQTRTMGFWNEKGKFERRNLSINAPYDVNFKRALDTVKRNLNIDSTANADVETKRLLQTQFNRFLIPFASTQIPKAFGHVFFTRPDLNLYERDKAGLVIPGQLLGSAEKKTLLGEKYIDSAGKPYGDPLFNYMHTSYPTLLSTLTQSFSDQHKFNPYLSNLAKNFVLKDDMIETIEHGETFTGFKIKYGKHNIKSRTADSLSIKFREDADYGVYKLHKAWTEYISRVYRGQFTPSDDNVRFKRLDYACSIYFILCGPDGETIMFWSKYTGVFPTSAPSSYSSWDGESLRNVEYSIQYDYSWREDLNPLHLAEFNINAHRFSSAASKLQYMSTYDPELVTSGRTFSAHPFIETVYNDDKTISYKLRFAPPPVESTPKTQEPINLTQSLSDINMPFIIA